LRFSKWHIVLNNSFCTISGEILGIIKPLGEQYRSLVTRSMMLVLSNHAFRAAKKSFSKQ
jgi:hypothetical protein